MSFKAVLFACILFSFNAIAQEGKVHMLNKFLTTFDGFKVESNGGLDVTSSGKTGWSKDTDETSAERVVMLKQSQVKVNGFNPMVQIRYAKSGALTEMTGFGAIDDKKESVGVFHVTLDANRNPVSATKCEDAMNCYSVTDQFCAKLLRSFNAPNAAEASKYVNACFNMPFVTDKQDYGLQAEAATARARLKEFGKDVQALKLLSDAAFSRRDRTDHGVAKRDETNKYADWEHYTKVVTLCDSVDYKSWMQKNPAAAPASGAAKK